MIAACRAHGSRRIIYSSSPSVVFNGLDMEGVDESVPYSARFEAAYPETKARAEQIILGSNTASLATISIRPHLIWGPGDNNLLPRILARARRGQLRRIGRRDPLIDPIYIDNAALAHLLAADRLEPGSPIAGRTYFVTQGETIPLWDMINHFLKAAGLAPVKRSVSRPLAFAAAGLLELAYVCRTARSRTPHDAVPRPAALDDALVQYRRGPPRPGLSSPMSASPRGCTGSNIGSRAITSLG